MMKPRKMKTVRKWADIYPDGEIGFVYLKSSYRLAQAMRGCGCRIGRVEIREVTRFR